MKRRSKLNRFICTILAIVLALEILTMFSVTLAKLTVGDRNFIEGQFEKSNFYTIMKDDAENAFKNYVYQSNLDESTVEGIVTNSKIKEDILIIIDRAYNGSNKQIDNNSLKEELTRRIKDKVKEESGFAITEQEEKNIQELVNIIIDNYTESIDIIRVVFDYITPIIKLVNRVSIKHIIAGFAVTFVTCSALSVIYVFGCKNKKVVVNKYQGIAFMTVGFLLIGIYITMSIIINENAISIYNKAVTTILNDLIRSFKITILLWGTSFSIIGISISLIKNIIVKEYLR